MEIPAGDLEWRSWTEILDGDLGGPLRQWCAGGGRRTARGRRDGLMRHRWQAKLDALVSTEPRAFDLGMPTGRLWTVALGG
jgi:hypothetical protein